MARKIRTTLLEPIDEEWLCDAEGCSGTMVSAGMSLPPKYHHKCSSCGREDVAEHQYPRIMYRVKNVEESGG